MTMLEKNSDFLKLCSKGNFHIKYNNHLNADIFSNVCDTTRRSYPETSHVFLQLKGQKIIFLFLLCK